MKRYFIFLAVLISFLFTIVSVFNRCLAENDSLRFTEHVAIIPMKMAILPGTQAYLERSMQDAIEHKAALIVIELDTPGGLLNSTQEMVQKIFQSPVPVIVYIAPSGAMAASAGTFLTLAAHIAAMAPSTTIGAAHPVQGNGKDIDGDMRAKSENITASLMKAISEQRGRNADWAEKAIRDSNSITPKEALKLKVIDLVANNLDELLKNVEDKSLEIKGKKISLTGVSRLPRINYELSFKEQVINFLAEPNILALLWFAATTGLAIELYHPGGIFPGVIGIVSLFIALGVSQVIPVSNAGVLLMIVGGLLIGAEIFITSGILGLGGVIAMIFGSIYLIDEAQAPGLDVSISFSILMAVVFALMIIFIIHEGRRAFSSRHVTGQDGMVGLVGEAVQDFHKNGKVFVNGEYWQAKTNTDSEVINKGDKIQVVATDNGLSLLVKKI